MVGSDMKSAKASRPGISKRTWLWLLVGTMWSGIVVSLVYVQYKSTFRNAIYVGVVAPLSGKYADVGVPIRDGVKMYFDEVNRQGGIKGKKVILIEKDDQNIPELAKLRATELAQTGGWWRSLDTDIVDRP